MMVYFASKNPTIAFTHIYPGFVNTPGLDVALDLGWAVAPLTWILLKILRTFAITPAVCAEHMLYALLDGEKGVFFRNELGDIVGSYMFDESQSRMYDAEYDSPFSEIDGLIKGVPVKGYGGCDMGVRLLMLHTEEVLKASQL